MDLGTVVGLVLAFALIASAMMLGGGIAPFMDAQSALIVIGGTFSATMVCQKLPNVKATMALLMQAVFDKTSPMDELIPVIIHLAAKARKEGLVSLKGETIEDLFMARGVRLGVDVLNFGPFGGGGSGDVTIQFGGAGSTVNTFSRDRFDPGTLQSVSIGLDGVLSGQFSNGANINVAQLGLAVFPNLEGLVSIGNNRSIESDVSGQPLYGGPTTGNFG